jgi:hypothetical protein
MAASTSLAKAFVLWERITYPSGTPVYENGVDFIDQTTQMVVAKVSLPLNTGKAWGIGENEATGHVYVAAEGGIFILDGHTNALVTVDDAGNGTPILPMSDAGYYVHPAAVAADNGNVYILGNESSVKGTLVVLDGTNDTIKATVDLGNTKYTPGSQYAESSVATGGIAANTTTHKVYMLTGDGAGNGAVLTILDGTSFGAAEPPITNDAGTPGTLWSDTQSANVIYTVGTSVMAVDPATAQLTPGWVPSHVIGYGDSTSVLISAYNCALDQTQFFYFNFATGHTIANWPVPRRNNAAPIGQAVLWGPPSKKGKVAISYTPSPCPDGGQADAGTNVVDVFDYN